MVLKPEFKPVGHRGGHKSLQFISSLSQHGGRVAGPGVGVEDSLGVALRACHELGGLGLHLGAHRGGKVRDLILAPLVLYLDTFIFNRRFTARFPKGFSKGVPKAETAEFLLRNHSCRAICIRHSAYLLRSWVQPRRQFSRPCTFFCTTTMEHSLHGWCCHLEGS